MQFTFCEPTRAPVKNTLRVLEAFKGVSTQARGAGAGGMTETPSCIVAPPTVAVGGSKMYVGVAEVTETRGKRVRRGALEGVQARGI